jgi:hypothetical protein
VFDKLEGRGNVENKDLDACVVCVESPGGRSQGTGFVVSPTLAVTCSHMVEVCEVRSRTSTVGFSDRRQAGGDKGTDGRLAARSGRSIFAVGNLAP